MYTITIKNNETGSETTRQVSEDVLDDLDLVIYHIGSMREIIDGNF